MEGNIFVLFLALFLGFLFVLALIVYKFSDSSSPKPGTSPLKASSVSFVRHDYVSGELIVDGHRIPTFNSGTITLDDVVSITFYCNFNAPVKITDIVLNGISIFSFTDTGTSYRNQADYALQVLKQTANQNSIDRSLVNEVEQIVLDVDSLNKLIKDGNVVQVPGDTEYDFTWRR